LHSACIGGNVDIAKHLVSVATAAGNRQFIGVADSTGRLRFMSPAETGMPPARVLWAGRPFTQPVFCMAAHHFLRLADLAALSSLFGFPKWA